ncbi:MAG: flagellar hook protein FlgE [Kofleriaceae bacterium]
MSIFDSLYIGVNGLQAHGDAISIVGDNIANASTVGYKRDRAQFSDMLGGVIDGQRAGGGVHLGASQTMFQQGQITTTGSPLDMALNGHGLFVVSGNHDGRNSNFYTRNGQFSLDSTGYVVNPGGLRLQGYTIDATGTRSQSVGDIDLSNRQSPAVATTTANMTLNLDSQSVTPAAAWDPANPTATSNYSTSSTTYDSLGKAHQTQVYFRNNGGGAWEWHAMVDGGDLTGGTAGTQTEIGSGTMTFNTNGALASQTTIASSANFRNATPNQNIAFKFGDDIASGGTGLAGTTQYASTSAVSATDIDGRASGKLTDVAVNSDGTIMGTYDNGQTEKIAQVAVAAFQNEAGLTRSGDNLYAESADSGQPLVDSAGTGSRGSIAGGSLESSNVDLSNELVTLIAYQRAFEANSKTVTTANEMLQTVSNLKQ